jgi:cyanophycinase-like exopeptidase
MLSGHQTFMLFGTGDWGEWCDGVFRQLALGGGHAAVITAGQSENGPEAVESYRQGAKQRLGRAGVRSIDVPLLAPGDGDSPAALETLEGAAFVYVLGGGPKSAVDALSGSAFMAAVWSRHVPYVGSSGGSMLLGARYPTSLDFEMAPALGVFPQTVIAAHWNELETMRAGLQRKFESDSCGGILIGIDTDAALAGDGKKWRVAGKNQVHVLCAGSWATYHDGDEFELALFP